MWGGNNDPPQKKHLLNTINKLKTSLPSNADPKLIVIFNVIQTHLQNQSNDNFQSHAQVVVLYTHVMQIVANLQKGDTMKNLFQTRDQSLWQYLPVNYMYKAMAVFLLSLGAIAGANWLITQNSDPSSNQPTQTTPTATTSTMLQQIQENDLRSPETITNFVNDKGVNSLLKMWDALNCDEATSTKIVSMLNQMRADATQETKQVIADTIASFQSQTGKSKLPLQNR